jgi:hypothetical protein
MSRPLKIDKLTVKRKDKDWTIFVKENINYLMEMMKEGRLFKIVQLGGEEADNMVKHSDTVFVIPSLLDRPDDMEFTRTGHYMTIDLVIVLQEKTAIRAIELWIERVGEIYDRIFNDRLLGGFCNNVTVVSTDFGQPVLADGQYMVIGNITLRLWKRININK